MNFVDEEHLALLHIRKQRRQVSRALDSGATGGMELRSHLVSHDSRQRGFPQARGAVKEEMVQRFASAPGGLNENRKVFPQPILADHLVQALGAKALLGTRIGALQFETKGATIYFRGAHRASLFRATRIRDSIEASSPASREETSATRSAWFRG